MSARLVALPPVSPRRERRARQISFDFAAIAPRARILFSWPTIVSELPPHLRGVLVAELARLGYVTIGRGHGARRARRRARRAA